MKDTCLTLSGVVIPDLSRLPTPSWTEVRPTTKKIENIKILAVQDRTYEIYNIVTGSTDLLLQLQDTDSGTFLGKCKIVHQHQLPRTRPPTSSPRKNLVTNHILDSGVEIVLGFFCIPLL